MRKFFLTASVLALTVATASVVSANETSKFNTASCNYAPANVKIDKDGRQNYPIICIRESASGYQRWSFGIGKDTTVKMTASGKNQLVYSEKTRTLKDGNKTIFTYKGTNIRSAVVPNTNKSVVFTAKSPTLADFATYFNNNSICAQ
jgi:hypothetical protein